METGVPVRAAEGGDLYGCMSQYRSLSLCIILSRSSTISGSPHVKSSCTSLETEGFTWKGQFTAATTKKPIGDWRRLWPLPPY